MTATGLPLEPQAIISHRGKVTKHDHANSIDAFRNAIAAGTDYLEMDVHRTRDGFIVVNHDAKVGGLFLGSKIKDLTYAELLEIDPKVPQLRDVIELSRGRARLDVEIKQAGYEADVVRELTSNLHTNDFLVKSFKPDVVRAVEQLRPDITTGLLLWAPWSSARDATKVGADFVAGMHQTLYGKLARESQELGIPYLDWSIKEALPYIHDKLDDSPRLRKLVQDPRVAGIITDETIAARELRDANLVQH